MILQTLLVSKDDQTAETLIQVLAQFGVAVARSNVADVAVARLTDEHFDLVIVDFDDPETASLMLEGCRRLASPGGAADHRAVLPRCVSF
jgi:DNA-binding response OmpR family regulator